MKLEKGRCEEWGDMWKVDKRENEQIQMDIEEQNLFNLESLYDLLIQNINRVIKMIKAQLVFLIVTASALHAAHKQTTEKYNATNYLSELEKRQNQFKADILSIRAQIDQMNKTLNSSTLTPNQQLTTLSEGMADQRDTLYNIETYLNMPFEIEPCKCQLNLTADQRDRLQQQIDTVRQSLQNLSSQVDFCPECPQIKQIKQQIKKQQNYLQVIQATVHSNCLQKPYQFVDQNPNGLVNLANSLYKDNLKATNWIYGSTTQQDYRMSLFSLATQYNLTSCPILTPYVDPTLKKCVACFGTYNLGQKKCYPCPDGQHYDPPTMSCVPNPKQCPAGTQLNATTNNCDPITCPQGTKLDVASSKCVPLCTGSQFYNFNTRQCETSPINCSAGYFYNATSQKCEVIICPFTQVYNTLTKQCQDKNTTSMCPLDRPYWNSTALKCQPCPAGYPLYNRLYNRCEACPQGAGWNQTTGKCQIQIPQCKANSYWDAAQSRCVCNVGYISNGTDCLIKLTDGSCNEPTPILNSVANNCEACPADRPYYVPVTRQCINCPAATTWNNATKNCDQIVCPAGTKLNLTTKKCDSITCPPGTKLNVATNNCDPITCPAGTRLNAATNNCDPIACPVGTRLNASTNNCDPITCPAGTRLNPSTNNCDPIACPAGTKLNAATNNCDSIICPADKPYLNLQANACQACPPNSYYNIASKRCEYCPSGSSYDLNRGQCVIDTIVCPQGYFYNSVSKKCQASTCPPGYRFNSATKLCETCGAGTFYNSTIDKCQSVICSGGFLNPQTQSCQQCPAGTYPEPTGKTCVSCEAGSFYSPDQKGCVKCPAGTYPDMAAFACHQCPSGTTYNPNTKLCQQIVCGVGQYYSLKDKTCKTLPGCPAGQYFNQSKQSCVAYPICGPNQILNQATKQCQQQASCPNEYYYNNNTGQCQKSSFVTSPNSPNLIYAYPFDQYVQQYNARRAADPYSRDCPSNTPYFDRNARVCVACTSANPYFNLHTNLCQNCGNSNYDNTQRNCASGGVTVNPTLERLIMNIL